MRLQLRSGLAVLVAMACSGGGDGGTPPPAPVATVSVAVTAPTLQVGQTTQATATPRDAQGNALSGRSVTWSASTPAIASVDGAGVVTAVAPGTATVTATVEGKSGSAAITVIPIPVATVSVTLNAPTIFVGQTTQATAVARDAANNVLTGRTLTWASSNTSVATVSTTGLVAAVAAGTATISASSEGKTGQAALTVQPDPATQTVVQITSITANGTPADLTKLAGQIALELNVTTPGGVPGTVTVTIGGVEFHRSSITPSPPVAGARGSAGVNPIIDVNTADYNTLIQAEQIQALPLRRNGTYDLAVGLQVTINGQTYTNQQTRSVTLQNVNTLLGVARVDGPSVLANNVRWEAGELQLRPAYIDYQNLPLDEVEVLVGNTPAMFGGFGSSGLVNTIRTGPNPFATMVRFDKTALPGASPSGGTSTSIPSYRQFGGPIIKPYQMRANLGGVCADLDGDGFADQAPPPQGFTMPAGCQRFQYVPSLTAKLNDPLWRPISEAFRYDHKPPVVLAGAWRPSDRPFNAGDLAISLAGKYCCADNYFGHTLELRATFDWSKITDAESGIDNTQPLSIWVGPQSTISGIKIPANLVPVGGTLGVTSPGAFNYAYTAFTDRLGNMAGTWMTTSATNPYTDAWTVDPTPGDFSWATFKVTDNGGIGSYTGVEDGRWFNRRSTPHFFSANLSGSPAGYPANPFSLFVGYRSSVNATPLPLIGFTSNPALGWQPTVISSTGGSTATGSYPASNLLASGVAPGTGEGYRDIFFCGAGKSGLPATGLSLSAQYTTPQYQALPGAFCRNLTVGLDLTTPTTSNNSPAPSQIGTGSQATVSTTVNDNLAVGRATAGVEYRSFPNGSFDAGYVYFPIIEQNYLQGPVQLQTTSSMTRVFPWAVYLTDGMGVPFSTGYSLTHLYYQGFDRAGNASARSSVPVTGVGTPPTNPFNFISSVALLVTAAQACTAIVASCGIIPTSTTLTYRVRTAQTAAPFLYAMAFAITASEQTRLLCVATAYTVAVVAGLYQYDYSCTMDWFLWNLAVTGAYQLAMLGVSDTGLALKYGLFVGLALWASATQQVY